MAYRLTRRSKTKRMNYFKIFSKGKSNGYKLGLAKGLRVGSKGKEREFLNKRIEKYSKDGI